MKITPTLGLLTTVLFASALVANAKPATKPVAKKSTKTTVVVKKPMAKKATKPVVHKTTKKSAMKPAAKKS